MRKVLKMILLCILILFISCIDVNAGRGCCSHHEGVDKTRCTTDGREVCKEYIGGKPVISNGDDCGCEPSNFDQEHLVVVDGNYETHPYDYESSDYNSYNNNNVIKSSYNQEENNTLKLKDIILIIILLFPYIIGVLSFIYEVVRDLIDELKEKLKNKNKKNDYNKGTKIIPIYNNIYKCPYCRGQLVKRMGRYGMFLGCSNYPRCKYTRNIKAK